jgi:co-chaperonin GroES (HSP10)
MAGRDAVPVMLGPLAVRIGAKSLAAADEIRGRLFTARSATENEQHGEIVAVGPGPLDEGMRIPKARRGRRGRTHTIRIGEHTHARKEGFGGIAT